MQNLLLVAILVIVLILGYLWYVGYFSESFAALTLPGSPRGFNIV